MCNFSMSVDFLSHFSMSPPRDYLFTPMSSLVSVDLRLLSSYPGLYLSAMCRRLVYSHVSLLWVILPHVWVWVEMEAA